MRNDFLMSKNNDPKFIVLSMQMDDVLCDVSKPTIHELH